VATGILVLSVSLFLLINTPQKTNRAYGEALRDYAAQLQDDGLTAVNQISPNEGGEAFITVLLPDTGEVTEQEAEDLTELIVYSANVFEKRDGFRSDDIFITFQRPVNQQIIFVSRPAGLPAPLGLIGEMTITSAERPGFVLSIVNLSGTPKALGRAYTTAWIVIQSVCLGYATWQEQDADPVCNILSANAAAGWVGIDRDVAKNWLNTGGSTDLGYLGSNDYQFRFIDFVFDEFVRR